MHRTLEAWSEDILLVEDNPNDAELTLRALRRAEGQPSVRIARDGAEALEYLRVGAVPLGDHLAPLPRVVLLDLKLPRIDGLQVLERIRGEPRLSHLPVVVLTSSREPDDIERCYAMGANSYVVKPVDFGAFAESVRQLGRYWLQLNEAPPAAQPPAGAGGA